MRYCLLMFVGSAALLAQTAQPLEQDLVQTDQPSVSAKADPYVPLTLAQQYAWTFHQTFDPGRLAMVAVRAALDHASDNPAPWGQGMPGYGERFGSHLARVAVRENLAFAVRALDHEDPRYFRAAAGTTWQRTRHAVSRTFIVRNEHGGTMPAYSLAVSVVATPFIAQNWQPGPFHPVRVARAGATGIGMATIGNLCQEFWPDLRNKFWR